MRSISIKSRPTFTRTPGGTREPPRSVHDAVRPDVGRGEAGFPELSRADEHRAGPASFAPPMSASMSSPTITASVGAAPSSASAASKYARVGLPTTSASTPAAYSRPATNAPPSRRGPARGLPPAVAVQTDETRPGVELGKRTVQVLVAEDAPGLLGLVRPAEEHDLGVAFDELDLGTEILPHGVHRQREDAPAREQA